MENKNSTLGVVALIILVIALGIYLRWYASLGQNPAVVTTETATTTASISSESTTTPPAAPKASQAPYRPLVAKDGSYLIYYTDKGFYPASITVKVGKSVRFINTSNKAMRIFPTLPDDRIYGQLHQGKTVGKNGTFDYAFSQKGVWGYYNENNKSDHGVIIVD
jgi:plastocyanin